MLANRPVASIGLALLLGVAIGVTLTQTGGSRRLLASGSDRWGDRAIASGPIAVDTSGDEKQAVAIPQDAVYYLNYSTGKLLATIPAMQQTAAGTTIINDFAERDLLVDFGIQPGVNPHFLMTTASLGLRGEGWAPLIVVETETGQMATYKVSARSTAGSRRPIFQLMDRRVDRRLGKALAEDTRHGL